MIGHAGVAPQRPGFPATRPRAAEPRRSAVRVELADAQRCPQRAPSIDPAWPGRANYTPSRAGVVSKVLMLRRLGFICFLPVGRSVLFVHAGTIYWGVFAATWWILPARSLCRPAHRVPGRQYPDSQRCHGHGDPTSRVVRGRLLQRTPRRLAGRSGGTRTCQPAPNRASSRVFTMPASRPARTSWRGATCCHAGLARFQPGVSTARRPTAIHAAGRVPASPAALASTGAPAHVQATAA
jgi:hypothetical protein